MRKRFDLVFFASIYADHFFKRRESEFFFPFSWSGLYIFSGQFRRLGPGVSREQLPDHFAALFRCRRLKSLAVLDSEVAARMERVGEHPVIAFPDLTDHRVNPNSQIATDLKIFAAGVPVIGLFGYLKPSKNAIMFAKLALDSAYSDLCFALVGEFPASEYSEEERNIIASLSAKRPNVFTRFERIREEADFNSCFLASDVIFAAYRGFAESSGILTKAAVFRKPVIVSDGYLVAERVRGYKLGSVIPEGDIKAAGDAIRTLLRQPSDSTSLPDWDGYCKEHSYEQLKAAFAKVLAVC